MNLTRKQLSEVLLEKSEKAQQQAGTFFFIAIHFEAVVQVGVRGEVGQPPSQSGYLLLNKLSKTKKM
ncbi:hypothetical protein SADUNF_Sadunf01G0130500 [Salix dunnii]|uniref:Uncharacterized protein n=1 Tax=Salix dunnii TaxID=1413687 RepID=A0A835NB30_9ROSI|nr:hypothetical protein SADUNF_Sadunf01G0130500 [Salix dunnii]